MVTMSFVVDGLPIPKARPRVLRTPRKTRAGKLVYAYTPDSTKAYQRYVLARFMEAGGLRTRRLRSPTEVSCLFHLPGKIAGPHVSRPDLDNLLKSVMDALNGSAWTDDSWIFKASCEKRNGTTPFARISITWYAGGEDA